MKIKKQTVAIVTISALLITSVYVLFNGNPITKSKIDKAADTYLLQSYPEIRDKVQRSVKTAYYRSGIGGIELTGNSPYDRWWVQYTCPDTEHLSFMLQFDKNGNLLFDGYRDNYLKGSTLYDYYAGQYNRLVIKAYNEEFNRGLPGNKSGGFSVKGEFDDSLITNRETEYKGPYIDVNSDHNLTDIAELCANIKFNYSTEVSTMEIMQKRRSEVRDFITKYSIPFHTVTITFNYEQGVYNLTAYEFYSDNLNQIIKDAYQD